MSGLMLRTEHIKMPDLNRQPGHDQDPVIRHPTFWIKKGV